MLSETVPSARYGVARGFNPQGAVSGVVTVAVIAWELWFVVSVWRGGRLPVPFIDWTTDGHPFVAILLFLFGTPFLSAVAFTLTMAIAGPLVLAFGRRA